MHDISCALCRLRGQVEQIMVENIDLHRQLLALQKRHVAVLEMLVQQQDASKPTAVGSNSHHLQHTFPFHASSSCQQDGQLFSASSQDRWACDMYCNRVNCQCAAFLTNQGAFA